MKRKAGDVEIKKEFEPPSKKQKLAATKPNKQKRKRVDLDPEIVNNSFINESSQNTAKKQKLSKSKHIESQSKTILIKNDNDEQNENENENESKVINGMKQNVKTEEICAALDHLDSNQAPIIQELTDYVTQMVDKMNLTFSVSMENMVHLKNQNDKLKKENLFLKSKRNKDGFPRNRGQRDRNDSFHINVNDNDERENEDGDIYHDEMEKLRKENESLNEMTQKLKKNVGLLTNRISVLHPKVQFLEMELEKYKDGNMRNMTDISNFDQYQDGIDDVDIYEAPHVDYHQIAGHHQDQDYEIKT